MLSNQTSRLFSTFKIKNRKGVVSEVEFSAGDSVYEAVDGAGITDVKGVCGGNGICGKCHLYAGKSFGKLVAPESDELDLLGRVFKRKDDSRIGCMLKLEDKNDGVELESAPWP